MDEPLTMLAFYGMCLLFAKEAFARWMTWKEGRRTNGVKNERGSAGNGPRVTLQRLDVLDKSISELRQELGRLRSKLQEVDALAQRLDERTTQK